MSAWVFVLLLCAAHTLAEPSRRLLQNGSNPQSLGVMWAAGQGRITDSSAIASATSVSAANEVARSAGNAYAVASPGETGQSAFAQAYAESLASAASQNVNAAAQVMAQSSIVGGDAQIAFSVAIANAFSGPGYATAFAEAMTVTISAYGCETIAIALAQATAIADADGTASAFATASSSVSTVGNCADGNIATANAEATAQAVAFGGNPGLGQAPAVA